MELGGCRLGCGLVDPDGLREVEDLGGRSGGGESGGVLLPGRGQRLEAALLDVGGVPVVHVCGHVEPDAQAMMMMIEIEEIGHEPLARPANW